MPSPFLDVPKATSTALDGVARSETEHSKTRAVIEVDKKYLTYFSTRTQKFEPIEKFTVKIGKNVHDIVLTAEG